MKPISGADKRKLRSRWDQELLLELNTALIRSTPKKPCWSQAEVEAKFGRHVVAGKTYVDMRGLELYELRNVEWTNVDFSASWLHSGPLGPRLIGTGSLGNVASRFSECLFLSVDAGHANFAGHFRACDFSSARLRHMNLGFGVKFEGCVFRSADLRRCRGSQSTVFIDCDFSKALMDGFDFDKTLFERCTFDGASFNGASLLGTRFVSCEIAGAAGESVMMDKVIFDATVPPNFSPFEFPNLTARGSDADN